jgi:hypothetical protein
MTPEKREALFSLLEGLSAADQSAVISFAEFLSSRGGSLPVSAPSEPELPVEIPEPENIPRPREEKVVAAVKRLSKTYFMLDKKAMLGETSDLVTQHVIQGRDVVDVIDELEALFIQKYQALKDGGQD